MALNAWWSGDPGQRYWIEVTQRTDLGENLLAPQRDGAGRENWSYTLVAHVRPGDRVLHYRTSEPGGAAFVGWSEVIGDPTQGVITWQARGVRGRARGVATTGPSWFVPLGGLHEFTSSLRGRDLSVREAELLALRDALEARHGRPVYFPFTRYRPGEVRAMQGYLSKLPVELIDLLPGLQAATTQPSGDLVEDEVEADVQGRVAVRGQLTRVQDPVLRAAIERRAVDTAKDHYRNLGATDITEVGKPYDLRCSLGGTERHVEVKGSSMVIRTVELTIGEVAHAEAFQPTDLAVVDEIHWSRASDGTITTSGGRLRVWTDWAPEDESLLARRFAYLLPAQ